MTLDALVPLLRCPSCDGRFAFEAIEQAEAAAGTCGLLRCDCGTYPVLDSVPILRKGHLAHRMISDSRLVDVGTPVDAIAAAIRDGEGLDALVRVLSAPVCPWPLNRIGAARRLSVREPLRRLGLAARRQRVRWMLRRRERLTAEDWMAASTWHAPVAEDPFNYFFFRFGQPRHLVALGIATAIVRPDEPTLDLACGYGHLLHTLSVQGRPAVGVDQNMHQVWTARHFVAPGAAFVCADANAPLPFRDGALGAALCSDAFHYLPDKVCVVAELRRCTEGPVALVTVSNGLVPPVDGDEWTPSGYAALFDGLAWRVRTEADLLVRYLDGLGPDLSESSAPGDVASSKWLTYVAAEDDGVLRNHGAYTRWPHLEGDEALNPLYDLGLKGATLRWPSPWYAVENGQMAAYLPATIPVGDPVDELARVGLPERYARARRPLAFTANRALSHAAARLHARP